MTLIHPSAQVSNEAQIHPSVKIGPFCLIEGPVNIGEGCVLESHVVVKNRTTLGKHNIVHPFSVLGGPPQDLKYKGEATQLVIGDHNVIRESVTMNIGTASGASKTTVGSHGLFMAQAHIAHDCSIGDHVILGLAAGLAGHINVASHVVFGGMAGAHQFIKIGRHAFFAGGAKASQDVPPFCIVQGDRAQLVGINAVGLKRSGMNAESITYLRKAFRRLFLSNTTRQKALSMVESQLAEHCEEVVELLEFVKNSERGICRPRTGLASLAPDEDEVV